METELWLSSVLMVKQNATGVSTNPSDPVFVHGGHVDGHNRPACTSDQAQWSESTGFGARPCPCLGESCV
jgi:hypothetical protein